MAAKSAVLVFTLYCLSLASGQGRRKTRASPLNGLLQNILSPTNTDGALQLLKQVASRNRYPVAEERVTNGLVQGLLPACANQRVVFPNQGNLAIPNQQVLQQLFSQQIVPNQQYVLPQQIYSQQVVLPQQQLLPQQVILPQQQMLPQPVVLPQQQFLPPQVFLPQQSVIEIESYAPQIEVRKAPVIQTVQPPVTTPVVVEKPCSCPAPAPLVNPFLPAASPVSAIAPPVSNLLPPADLNNCRCQYLRKIPIPPPCL